MPLINVLAMCANISPTTVAIADCSEHISQGGKKDASFIASMMEDLVVEYDPTKSHTDIFFFDGAAMLPKQVMSYKQNSLILIQSMVENMLCVCSSVTCQSFHQ
jgi:hypothetical protein